MRQFIDLEILFKTMPKYGLLHKEKSERGYGNTGGLRQFCVNMHVHKLPHVTTGVLFMK